MSSCSSASTSNWLATSFRPKIGPVLTAEGDVVIYLDKNEIEDGLMGWEEMHSAVEVEFLKRELTDIRIDPAHWAFLLRGPSFFCTIDYGDEGIVIKYYKRTRGIEAACKGIMGRADWIQYDDCFHTNMDFAAILREVDNMKSDWSTTSYQTILHNCQNFVHLLGDKILTNFNHVNYVDVVLRSEAPCILNPKNFNFQHRELY